MLIWFQDLHHSADSRGPWASRTRVLFDPGGSQQGRYAVPLRNDAIAALAREYQVSQLAMTLRMTNLEIITQTDDVAG